MRQAPVEAAGFAELCGFFERGGGGDGIRTHDRGLSPYNGLANRRLQPLGHPSAREKAWLTAYATPGSREGSRHCQRLRGGVPSSSAAIPASLMWTSEGACGARLRASPHSWVVAADLLLLRSPRLRSCVLQPLRLCAECSALPWQITYLRAPPAHWNRYGRFVGVIRASPKVQVPQGRK
jgi:hypothetical protein